jgi:hypothetical protein
LATEDWQEVVKAEMAVETGLAAAWATEVLEAVTWVAAGSASAAVTLSAPLHQRRPAAEARTRAR